MVEKSGFGENLTFVDAGLSVVQRPSVATFYSAAHASAAVASNNGRVSWIGDAGVWGKGMAVDHGLGIFTVYTNIGTPKVAVGDAVTRGQEIATAGEGGSAFGYSLGFHIRVQGVAVRPLEWWDKYWLRDHIESKLKDVSQVLGVAPEKLPTETSP
jgi:hypothetical protein